MGKVDDMNKYKYFYIFALFNNKNSKKSPFLINLEFKKRKECTNLE